MIFDLDGTLFQTDTLLIPAYERTFEQLKAEGKFSGDVPSVQIMIGALGNLLLDIWKKLLPDASEKMIREADELLLMHQLQGLENGEGNLFPDVEHVLARLKQDGIRLFIGSNGLEPYVKGVLKNKKLDHMFEGIYSAGEYRTQSKIELVRLLLQRHHIDHAWMVGDRTSDVEAGKANGLTVIGCDYAGFGNAKRELQEADHIITRFSDLLTLYR